MPINISPSTLEERKKLFAELLLNKTDKVSKISNHSALSGIAYGVAKVAGKAEKDIVIALSQLFPDLAFSSQLDTTAEIYGIAPRFGSSESSTYIRVVGDEGTEYLAGTHIFESLDGVQFDIEISTTIGEAGFSYVKARSVDRGVSMNVAPASINKVSPEPAGHRYCVNEYQAIGGRDVESDEEFRKRIKDGPNILATGTLAMVEQAFMKINNNILRVIFQGFNDLGQLRLAVVTVNGIDLTTLELNNLLVEGEKFFAFTELRPNGKQSYGMEVKNIEWQAVDMSFRVDIFSSFSVDDVRIEIQTKIAKYLDFRYWNAGSDVIEWDNLLNIVKNTKGVRYVADQFFTPKVDIATDKNKLPRLRAFRMLDLNGAIIQDLSGNLLPSFYPNVADVSLQASVLRNI